MTKAEEVFHNLANKVPEAFEGKMFGAKCLKLNTGKAVAIFWKDNMLFKLNSGKAVAIFWKDSMLFKLDDEARKEALKLEGAQIGAHLYDPKRPMKGWVSIPSKHSNIWVDFARMAVKNVKNIKSNYT
jgi:hypothetical protein